MGRLKSVHVTSADDIAQLGTILCVWAHPDDESFLAAGVLMCAIQNGQTVICVTATKGEAGSQDSRRWPVEQLGDIRASEMATALQILGIKQHHWLGYRDDCCKSVPEPQAVSKISNLLEKYRPDTILTFGPEGWTGNPDHQAVSKWVRQAVKEGGYEVETLHAIICRVNYEEYLKIAHEKINIFYNIETPPIYEEADCDIHFNLDHSLAYKKCRALRAMQSQTETLFKNFAEDELEKIFGVECFKRFVDA